MTSLDVADEDVAVPDRSLVAVVSRRITGTFPVDAWGLDVDAAAVARSLPGIRQVVRVEGAERLPDGPALLVQGRGSVLLERLPVAAGVAAAADRPVRATGVPDLALAIGAARRLGGVTGHPIDVRGLLLAGELVAMAVDLDAPTAAACGALASALDVGAPLVPVAVRPATPLRRTLVRIGRPVPTRRRRAARGADEVAETVRSQLSALLDG